MSLSQNGCRKRPLFLCVILIMEEGNGKFVRNETLGHVLAIGYHCAKGVQSNQDRGYSYYRRRIPFVGHDNRRWAEIPKDLSFMQVMNISGGKYISLWDCSGPN